MIHTSRLWSCNWDWCPETFPERFALLTHLNQVHFNKILAVPHDPDQPPSPSPIHVPSTPPRDQTHSRSSFHNVMANSSPMSTPSAESLPPSPALAHRVAHAVTSHRNGIPPPVSPTPLPLPRRKGNPPAPSKDKELTSKSTSFGSSSSSSSARDVEFVLTQSIEASPTHLEDQPIQQNISGEHERRGSASGSASPEKDVQISIMGADGTSPSPPSTLPLPRRLRSRSKTPIPVTVIEDKPPLPRRRSRSKASSPAPVSVSAPRTLRSRSKTPSSLAPPANAVPASNGDKGSARLPLPRRNATARSKSNDGAGKSNGPSSLEIRQSERAEHAPGMSSSSRLQF